MTTHSIQPNPRVTYAVRYEDEDILVVLKPPRLVTNPGVGHEHDTLLNGVFAAYGPRLQNLGKARDFGLLHRLDRDTSGLVAIALSQEAYDGLRSAFADRTVKKYYWAVSHKAPREPSGVIKRPIIEEERRRSKYTFEKLARLDAGGKPAVTAWRVLDASELGALIEARPVTGRLHQVRIHLDSIGAGIMGDTLYGPNRTSGAAHRLALHAHRLVFDHPVTGRRVDVTTPFPRDLRGLLRRLNLRRPDVEAETDTPGQAEAGGAGS